MLNVPVPKSELQAADLPASKPPTSKPPKLIKASAAVTLLENYVGGSLAAKELLVDKLRDGEIRAYALWTWVSHEPSLKKAWKSKPADAEKMVQVNRDRFLGSPTWRTDITRWKWNSGDFYCGGNVKNRKKIYRRVRFAAEDVENLAGKMKNTLLEIKKSQGGRNLKINARDDVWLTVLRLYHTNGIDAFKPLGRSTENITKQTNWTNTQEILEYSSIEGIVKKVRKELNIARRGPSKS